MKHVIGNKEYNIIDSWDELTLGQYIEYVKVETTTFDTVEEKNIRVIEILCGLVLDGLDNLTYLEYNELQTLMIEKINSLPSLDIYIAKSFDKTFEINGITYVTQTPETLNDVTLGEKISISTLQSAHTGHVLDFVTTLSAILIRPGKLVKDIETNIEVYEIEPFNKRDIKNMEYRKELFLKEAKAKDIIPVYNFFLSGIKQLLMGSISSLPE